VTKWRFNLFEPGWIREAPPHPGTYEDTPLELNVPPPNEDDYGPDYSIAEVVSSTPQSFLDPIWWSLGDAAEFAESTMESDDPDSSPQFSGLERIEQAIRAGKLQAYGSIDAAPVRAIPVEAWTEFMMIPSNIVSNLDDTLTYDVSVRSVKSYRASTLADHSFPSGDLVPSAASPQGEPGFHRVVSNAFVKESDARALFATRNAQGKERRVGPKQRRVAETLSRISVKGKSVFPDRGDIGFAEIARAVVKEWRKEDKRKGQSIEYNMSTEEQAVRRFYEPKD
jgi:hypothetical protein